MFSLYKHMYHMWHPGRANFYPQVHNLNKLGRDPLDDAILNETSKPPVNKTHFFNIAHLLSNYLK